MKSVAAVAVLVLVVGCGAQEAVETAHPVPDAAPDEQVTLFTLADIDQDASNFRISAAVPLPDGTVLVQWDPHVPSGGDDREPFSDPQLSVLGADGTLRPFVVPDTAETPGLLGVGPDGTAYVAQYRSEADGRAMRILARAPDDRWRVVPADLVIDFIGGPVFAIGPDGALYATDDNGLHRVAADGHLETLVGISRSTGSADPGAPPLPPAQSPVAARTVTLSDVWGLAVGPDGTVFASNRHEIVAIDPAGLLTLVTTMADLQTELGILSTLDPPFLWSNLAIDADGSLLVSDSYQQLVADLDGPSIVARHAVVASDGLNALWSGHHDLLLRLMDPNELQAGPSDPDQLAAFGR